MKKLNDLLWDGELKIYQDDNKFMFSLDSILLAYFVNIKKCAKNILDIGTGNAPIPLMLSKRTSADITGVEIQESSYLLAKESVQYNKLEDQINIINGDIKELSLDMKNNYYDTIVSNPPYFKSNTMMSNNDNKKIARSEVYLSLEDILKISKRLLKDKGNVAIVNRPDRLCDIFILMKKFLNCQCHTIFITGCSHIIGCLFHFIAGICHRNTHSSIADHRNIVSAITACHEFFAVQSELFQQIIQGLCLINA